jgi:hypothetical protein
MIRPVSNALTPPMNSKMLGRNWFSTVDQIGALLTPIMLPANRVIGDDDKQPGADNARISPLGSPLHCPHGHVVSDHSDGRARRRQDELNW